MAEFGRRLRVWLGGQTGMRVQKWLSIGISVILLLVLSHAMAEVGWRQIWDALPAAPLFYLLFAASYVCTPIFDWIIYRGWWRIGWRGIAVFVRKRVMNEALLSYSGETWLLIWAHRWLGLDFDPHAPRQPLLGRNGGAADPRQRPFAAIKDVAITSGLAGNLLTLLMLVLTLTMGSGMIIADALDQKTLNILASSFLLLILLNLGIVLLRGRVMSLSAQENLRLLRLHLARVSLTQGLLVLSWIVALPAIGMQTWVLLGAMRMIISRMPLPNKELLFAALAVQLTGDQSVAVAALMALQGAMHLFCHGIAYGAAAMLDASGKVRRPAPSR